MAGGLAAPEGHTRIVMRGGSRISPAVLAVGLDSRGTTISGWAWRHIYLLQEGHYSRSVVVLEVPELMLVRAETEGQEVTDLVAPVRVVEPPAAKAAKAAMDLFS